MKIGIIVDGDAESQALVNLVAQCSGAKTQIIKPVYADIQPKASYKQIAAKAVDRIDFLRSKNASKIVLLIDREDWDKCAVEIKKGLEDALKELGHDNVAVVVKERKFENWLIADLTALRSMPGRFVLTKAFENQVRLDRADGVVDAEKLLNSVVASRTPEYHKRRDAQAITSKQDLLRLACNSRSFRRFLRLLGHSVYAKQSKIPDKRCAKS